MSDNQQTLEEKILTPILEYFINVPDIDNHIENSRIKELVDTIRNMRIIIYSNDHEPPHFHVIAKDNSINAKFKIKDCTFLGGEIGSKDLKRIQVFHRDIKTQYVMQLIWNKRHGGGQIEKKKEELKTTRYNTVFMPLWGLSLIINSFLKLNL